MTATVKQISEQDLERLRKAILRIERKGHKGNWTGPFAELWVLVHDRSLRVPKELKQNNPFDLFVRGNGAKVEVKARRVGSTDMHYFEGSPRQREVCKWFCFVLLDRNLRVLAAIRAPKKAMVKAGAFDGKRTARWKLWFGGRKRTRLLELLEDPRLLVLKKGSRNPEVWETRGMRRKR